MAVSRSRAVTRDDGQTSGTSSKSVRATRRHRESAAAASASESARATPDVDAMPLSNGLALQYHSNETTSTTNGASGSSSSNPKKPSPLETNSITYTNNEFLAGKPSNSNPVQRELAIELLGKPVVVAIEENGLMSQPASVAEAIVEQQPTNYGADPEIERLPVEALRKYRTAYKLPVHSAQTFRGYLLDSPVGRKTWSYRYGASGGATERSLQTLGGLSEKDGNKEGETGAGAIRNGNEVDDDKDQRQAQMIPVASSATSRITKRALETVVKRNFTNQSIRESEVIVDFIYSVRTQSKCFRFW